MKVMVKPGAEALYPNSFTKGNGDKTENWANLIANGSAADLTVTSTEDGEDAKFKAEVHDERDVKKLDGAMCGGCVTVGTFEKSCNGGGGFDLDCEREFM